MKDHIKAITIVLIILIAYTIFVYAYASGKKSPDEKDDKNKQQDKKEDNTPTDDTSNYAVNIALFNKQFLGYKDGKWYENPKYEFANKYHDVYTATKAYKSKEIVYTDRWYIMDDDRSFIDYDDGFIAVSSNLNYNLAFGKEEKINDNQRAVIENFLQSKNIKYNYSTLKKSVMTYDLNRDGIHDNIYVVSNLFLNDYTGYDKTFAYVFVNTLNQNVVLSEETFETAGAVSICEPYVYSIITIEEKNTLILGCEYFSLGGNKYLLYNLEEKTANKLLETKAN